MIFNNLYRTSPKFVHASGRPEFLPLWETIKAIRPIFHSSCPSNLTIVTYNNGPTGYNGKTNGLFEQSLERAGIQNFVVLGNGIKKWMNKLKIQLLQSFLPQITTKYVLSSDSSDVLLVRPLNGITEDFDKFNCQMLFNAEKNIWPTDLPADIVKFERDRTASIFPFLNAGLWIARTEFLLQHLHELNDYKFETKHTMSEQIYYKYFYLNYSADIRVDCECKLFQNINRVEKDIIQINETYY